MIQRAALVGFCKAWATGGGEGIKTKVTAEFHTKTSLWDTFLFLVRSRQQKIYRDAGILSEPLPERRNAPLES